MPVPDETLLQETAGESPMKKSPLEISLDKNEYTIKITDKTKIENLHPEAKQPETNTEYFLGSLENLKLQKISIEGKLYTFELRDNEVIVIETEHITSSDKKFTVENQSVEIVDIKDGEVTYKVGKKQTVASYSLFIELKPHVLIKAEKASNTDPHLVVKTEYSL